MSYTHKRMSSNQINIILFISETLFSGLVENVWWELEGGSAFLLKYCKYPPWVLLVVFIEFNEKGL